MGKKGKRTKWQALPMEEDSTTTTTAATGNGAVGYKKFRPFSTYNGKWGSIKQLFLRVHHHHYQWQCFREMQHSSNHRLAHVSKEAPCPMDR